MVVTRSYQILLPKNDFLPFSHWYLHCNPKKVPTWEGKVVEQKQKQFWNQWSNCNNLGACKIGIFKLFSIRITLTLDKCHQFHKGIIRVNFGGTWKWNSPSEESSASGDLYWTGRCILSAGVAVAWERSKLISDHILKNYFYVYLHLLPPWLSSNIKSPLLQLR